MSPAAKEGGPFQGGTGYPDVAVVVVSHNTREDLVRCLGALLGVTRPLEVIVVDNASADGSADAVREAFGGATVMDAGGNLGFGAAANLGWHASRSPYVLFLNPDAEVAPGALEAMADVLDEREAIGIVGPATRNGDGTPQVSTGAFLTPLGEWRQRRIVRGVARREPEALREAEARAATEHEPDWVSGSCLLARREALEAVGGFDERFFLYEEDVDLCLRVSRLGWRTLFTPEARVIHRLGASMAREPARSRIEYERSHLLYYRKHHGRAPALALRGLLFLKGMSGLARALARRSTPEDRHLSRNLLRLSLLGR